MKKLLSLILLVSTVSYSQLRSKVLIHTDTFTVMYSEILEQPLEVKYVVACPEGHVTRNGLEFHKVPGVHTSDNADYSHNDYDKGHLAPAADFKCSEAQMESTFSYLNCSLQNKYLNRGTWKYLEEYERKLQMKYKIVSVQVLLNFSKDSKKLPTGATIPDSFTKIIRYNGKVEVYRFKNEKPQYKDFNKYRVN
jgi:endonuclease G